MGLTFRARDLAMIAAAAAACIVTACATAPGGGAAAARSATMMAASPTDATAGSPSPTGLPTAGAVIPTGPVTQADDRETLLLTAGQQITVVLAAPPRMWDQPTAQGGAVTRISASGGYPGTTPARAVFRAVAPGTAQLTSSTDMQCEHQPSPCPAAEQNWTVWVVVVQPGTAFPPGTPT
jgi:hypothetical protein